MKKLLNKKGFTLMEMLIVVAIIVILVAISIPTFSSSLESAKVATDAANLRSAKAAALMSVTNGTTPAATDYYDFVTGKFEDGSGTGVVRTTGECSAHSSAWIAYDASNNKVFWTADGSTEIPPCN